MAVTCYITKQYKEISWYCWVPFTSSQLHKHRSGLLSIIIKHTHFLCHMHIFTYNWALLIFVWACISDVISLLSIFVWACISDVIFLFFLKNFWETAKQIIVKKLEKSQMSKFYGILQWSDKCWAAMAIWGGKLWLLIELKFFWLLFIPIFFYYICLLLQKNFWRLKYCCTEQLPHTSVRET